MRHSAGVHLAYPGQHAFVLVLRRFSSRERGDRCSRRGPQAAKRALRRTEMPPASQVLLGRSREGRRPLWGRSRCSILSPASSSAKASRWRTMFGSSLARPNLTKYMYINSHWLRLHLEERGRRASERRRVQAALWPGHQRSRPVRERGSRRSGKPEPCLASTRISTPRQCQPHPGTRSRSGTTRSRAPRPGSIAATTSATFPSPTSSTTM